MKNSFEKFLPLEVSAYDDETIVNAQGEPVFVGDMPIGAPFNELGERKPARDLVAFIVRAVNTMVKLDAWSKHWIKYRGYTIARKCDYVGLLHYHRGFNLTEGFVVTNGKMTNVMPGAMWFTSPEDAAFAVDDLILVSQGYAPGRAAADRWHQLQEQRRAKIGLPLAWGDGDKTFVHTPKELFIL